MTAHRSLTLAVFLTLAPFVGGSVAAAPILDFTGGAARGTEADATFGWTFTVTSPITIGGLGLFDFGRDGLTADHEIGLWKSDGTLLTSKTITNANSTPVASTSDLGNWLSTPITARELTTGDYVIGAFYLAATADLFVQEGTASTITGVTFGEPRSAFGSSLQFPLTSDTFATAGYFGPNLFTTEVAPVPEPTSLILLGSGLAILAGRVARMKRRQYRVGPA